MTSFALHAKLTLYNCLIIPLFDCGDTVWGDKNNDSLILVSCKFCKTRQPRFCNRGTRSIRPKDPLKEMTLPSLCYDAKISFWGN